MMIQWVTLLCAPPPVVAGGGGAALGALLGLGAGLRLGGVAGYLVRIMVAVRVTTERQAQSVVHLTVVRMLFEIIVVKIFYQRSRHLDPAVAEVSAPEPGEEGGVAAGAGPRRAAQLLVGLGMAQLQRRGRGHLVRAATRLNISRDTSSLVGSYPSFTSATSPRRSSWRWDPPCPWRGRCEVSARWRPRPLHRGWRCGGHRGSRARRRGTGGARRESATRTYVGDPSCVSMFHYLPFSSSCFLPPEQRTLNCLWLTLQQQGWWECYIYLT